MHQPEREEQFRFIVNTAPVVIWMSNFEKGWTFVNQTWLELSGQSPAAALGNAWMDPIHPEDVVACWDTYAQAFDRREVFQMEFRLRRTDGTYRWIVCNGAPRYEADGAFDGYTGAAVDLTERRLAEEARASIRQRLVDAQEDERARIARRLHDDVVQRLSILSFNLHASKRRLPASAIESYREIEEACTEVSTLATDVLALAQGLHPARLDYLGIAAAAQALCRETARHSGIHINFTAGPLPGNLSTRITRSIYRVLQEALQNAVKHSGAETIDVLLHGRREEIELTVRDSGSGFNVETTKGLGLGLPAMKERLHAVRGRLVITSQLRGGTTIQACVPLASPGHDESGR